MWLENVKVDEVIVSFVKNGLSSRPTRGKKTFTYYEQ